MDFKAYLEARTARVNQALERLVPPEDEPPHTLHKAMRYSLFAGGKRVRPILALAAAEACGGDGPGLEDAACALELIHTYSLIHDDLPALDNDDLRRGRPTNHKVFGEAMAILAGDNLLALATAAAAAAPHNALEIQRSLADATLRMINGQVYDTLRGFPDDASPEAQLELVHRNKTGALIEVSCRMGALSACERGPRLDTLVDALAGFGATLGLMFQIVDDLIDATQSSEHAGKATGKDAAAGKLTYPAVHGVARSRAEVERLRADAHAALSKAGVTSGALTALVEFLASRTR